MKPFEIPNVAKAATPKPDLGRVGQEAGSELAQRLWQLLLPLPETGEAAAHEVSAAAMGSAGSAQSHRRTQDERDRDGTSELTSTAHILAAAVHQLGLTSYTQEAQAAGHSALCPPAPPAQGWQLQLGHVDAQGGCASLQVAHPQLGDITLDVELSNGVLRVIASAPNEYAAQVLLEGQAQLAERLLRQGVALEVLDVVVTNKRKDSKRARARARKQER